MQQTLLLLEDNAEHCRQIKALIEEYNQKTTCVFNIIAVTSTAEAKGKLKQRLSIDAFLLDISMDDTSDNQEGLDFAEHLQQIREYKDKPVLFLTAYGSFLPAALNKLHCYAFLMKPYNKEELFQQLSDLSSQKEDDFYIKTREGVYYKLQLDDLLYIHANGRYLNYITGNGCFSSRQHTLSHVLEILPDNFIRCHRSYIINSDFVVNYDFINHFVEIKNIKNRIPMSRKINPEIIHKGEK